MRNSGKKAIQAKVSLKSWFTSGKTALMLAMLLPFLCSSSLQRTEDPSLIPFPQQIALLGGHLNLQKGIYVISHDTSLAWEVDYLTTALRAERISAVRTGSGNRIPLHLSLDPAMDSLGPEAYRLQIRRNEALIQASAPAGIFYGIQTLLQLLPLEGKKHIPCLDISDRPRFIYRGMHLDVCRHFFGVDFIKRYLDQMARYKLNTFHWHLTEDQGWRIEIKRYPKLTSVGSVRKETMVEKNFNPYRGDGTPHGGYYTQEEVREIIAYAARRHIEVIPEIEMPGHSLAALSAYPELSCTGGPFEVATSWGVFDDIYCTKEETFVFLEHVLDEVTALFPGRYIHIGGDEAPKTRWKACPVCQGRMRAEGLEDEHALQSYFIRRIEKILTARNKKLIGWDEILEGGLAPDATVMSWRGEDGGIAAARQGHDVIMTPGFAMYFDHYQGDPKKEPLAICCYTPLQKVYAYDPVPAVLSPKEQQHILGVQANVWTEYIKTPEHVEYMVNPRLLALSEIAWTNKGRKDYSSFMRRIPIHLQRMDRLGINYRQPAEGE